jgi:hypothetical protein
MPRRAAAVLLVAGVYVLLSRFGSVPGVPFAVLAAAALAVPALSSRPAPARPSRDAALPGLAQELAEGTKARCATIWLAVGDKLVATASHPPAGTPETLSANGGRDTASPETDGSPDAVENLAVLLARPGVAHAVPVLDRTALRAVLSIEKPDLPVTPGDRALMRDLATGAALLLRTVALNAELADRVRHADRLAAELDTSRQRLAEARRTERRRLLGELTRATSGRLVTLRGHVTAASADHRTAGTALAAARAEVDELLDRFRVIARGVHPAVLRSQGPGPALAEMTADLPRPVRLTGDLGLRVGWEIESAIYQVTASALALLGAAPGPGLDVRLTHEEGRVRVLVADPAPAVTAAHVRTVLVDDIERLAALGGDVECPDTGGELRLTAWLPDRLDAGLAA